MTSRYCLISILSIVLICNLLPAYSQNLGTLGETYPIAEQDLLELIHDRLKALESNGGIMDLQNKLIKITTDKIDRPKGVGKITKAIQNRTWIFDPTVEIKSDITDANGNVIVKAGTKGNPLDIVNLTKILIFYDADDKSQVAWVQKLDKKNQGKTKLILINGSVFSQVKLFQKTVYFDQGGFLINYFKIKHVPATVTQISSLDNAKNHLNRLKISEIKV